MAGKADGVRASDLMVEFVQVPPQASAMDALKQMLEEKSHRVLIISDGRLKGIATTYDFVAKMPWGKSSLGTIGVQDIMTHDVFFAHPEDGLKHVVDLMYHRDVRFVPIVSEGVAVGIVSRREISLIFAEKYGKKYAAGDLMTYRYTTCTIHDSLDDFFRKIHVYGDKYIIIMRGEEVVGIVTPTDVLRYLLKKKGVEFGSSIREIMTHKPFTAKKTDRCDKLAKTMIERNLSGVPIIEQKLEGLIRFSCFLQFIEL